MKEHFTLRYSSTESESGDSIMDLEMNFDNPSESILIARLNTWLKAIGRENLKICLDTKSNDTNISGSGGSNTSKTVIHLD
jgi:hypothetical protein